MKTIRQILIVAIAVVAYAAADVVHAQDASRADSTSAQTDLLAVEPAVAAGDTSQSEVKPADAGIDTTVTYSARIVDTFKDKNETHLIGDATVKYKNITVKAGKITVIWNDNTLIAETLPDSGNGSNSNGADTLSSRLKGRPVFTDGREEMVGDRMEYNFKSERGRILRGRTQFQDGYYTGETVKRVEPQEFNVVNGRYSTCENEEPHFHFKGNKMKVIMGDKVVAKPVTFFIGKIPLAILPFAMFSTKE
ncbi:MAG TPA: hypothetical protein VGA99_02845, partial [bacterium]